jgi:general nucleoside transport system permease protein
MEALLEATLRLAAPLLLAALGELVVERAGLIHIGIEGAMLVGAFAGFAVASATGSAPAGVSAAILAGAASGSLFAAFAVGRGADQIVVGTAVNLLALGGTALAARALWAGAPPPAPTIAPLVSGAAAELPWIGPVLLRQTPFVWAGLALTALVGVALARTRAGLRLRAVGESARSADAEGVSVGRTRIAAVVFGSALAGLAGAELSLAQSDTFSEGMTAGRGFIALAIVIFGRWRASGVLLAALFFGLTTALQFRLQARGAAIPYPVSLMLPYLVTLAVLAFASGRGRAPGDLGRAYRREAA